MTRTEKVYGCRDVILAKKKDELEESVDILETRGMVRWDGVVFVSLATHLGIGLRGVNIMRLRGAAGQHGIISTSEMDRRGCRRLPDG